VREARDFEIYDEDAPVLPEDGDMLRGKSAGCKLAAGPSGHAMALQEPKEPHPTFYGMISGEVEAPRQQHSI
jgi:hypothetical protein